MAALSVAASLSLAAPDSAVAQSRLVVSNSGGGVSIHSESAPLGQLLRELAALTAADLRLDPAVEAWPVAVNVENVSVEAAIAAVLKASGVNFVAVGLERSSERSPIRVVAGDRTDARPLRTNTPELLDKDLPGEVPATPALPPDVDKAGEEERSGFLNGDDASSVTDAADAPGNMTGAEWMAVLFPPNRPPGPRLRGGPVILPVPTDNGQPLMVDVPAIPGAPVMLPFVGPDGEPLVSPGGVPGGLIMLPFTEAGRPLMVPGPGSGRTTSPVPGRPPGEAH